MLFKQLSLLESLCLIESDSLSLVHLLLNLLCLLKCLRLIKRGCLFQQVLRLFDLVLASLSFQSGLELLRKFWINKLS